MRVMLQGHLRQGRAGCWERGCELSAPPLLDRAG